MKYVVLEHGGKQYRAEEGQTIQLDRMALEVGAKVDFPAVLYYSDGSERQVGDPTVKGVKVTGKVANHTKGPKVTVFKYKPKIRYRRKQGHRQKYSLVEIDAIKGPKAEKDTPAKAEKAEKEPAKKGTSKKAPSKGKSSGKSAASAKRSKSSSSSKSTEKKAAAKGKKGSGESKVKSKGAGSSGGKGASGKKKSS